jgi:hypothetical protein
MAILKQRAVARLLPPESSPVEVASREIGIFQHALDGGAQKHLQRRARRHALKR